jgi:hypothetical protein
MRPGLGVCTLDARSMIVQFRGRVKSSAHENKVLTVLDNLDILVGICRLTCVYERPLLSVVSIERERTLKHGATRPTVNIHFLYLQGPPVALAYSGPTSSSSRSSGLTNLHRVSSAASRLHRCFSLVHKLSRSYSFAMHGYLLPERRCAAKSVFRIELGMCGHLHGVSLR